MKHTIILISLIALLSSCRKTITTEYTYDVATDSKDYTLTYTHPKGNTVVLEHLSGNYHSVEMNMSALPYLSVKNNTDKGAMTVTITEFGTLVSSDSTIEPYGTATAKK